jgi:hypothetical protein
MQFLIDHSIYVVLIVSLMVMLGMVLYLNRVDARLRRIEQRLDVAPTPRSGTHE